MSHLRNSRKTLTTLVAALAFTLALPALGANAPIDHEAPLVTLQLQADPHRPAVAIMAMGGHNYRMAIDTGASDTYMHLPIAQRSLTPAAEESAPPEKATGLHGEVELRPFNADPFTVDQWTPPMQGRIFGVDMGLVASEEGIDGVLGVYQLMDLDWHWDNRKQQVLGYSHGAKAVKAIKARLHCEQLKNRDGDPAVGITVGDEQAVFVIDTGDLGFSGGINPKDLIALEYRGAVRLSQKVIPQYDVDGSELVNLQAAQIQNVSLGPTRLDGLILREVNSSSRLGRAFISKFDEVLIDFETGLFCFPAVAAIEADDPDIWMSRD